MIKTITVDELLKDDVWTCARCGGKLIVSKYLWKGQIKSINYCKNCWDDNDCHEGETK